MSTDDVQTNAPRADAIAPLKAAIDHLARGETEACAAGGERRLPRAPESAAGPLRLWPGLDRRSSEHGARPSRPSPAAMRLAPDWADAWVNYGLARYRQGAIEDAKTAMRQALRHAPGPPGRDRQSRRPSCASPASPRPPRRCCARRSRASRTTPARGSISPPTCCRRNAPPTRWRCSTPRRPANRGPGGRAALAAAARRWRCCSSAGSAEARTALRRLAALGPHAARDRAAVALAAGAAGPGGREIRRAPRRRRRDGGGARRHGRRRGAGTPDHGALRSREILVGPGRARARLRAMESPATRC